MAKLLSALIVVLAFIGQSQISAHSAHQLVDISESAESKSSNFERVQIVIEGEPQKPTN